MFRPVNDQAIRASFGVQQDLNEAVGWYRLGEEHAIKAPQSLDAPRFTIP
jgi:hypothetical protein